MMHTVELHSGFCKALVRAVPLASCQLGGSITSGFGGTAMPKKLAT